MTFEAFASHILLLNELGDVQTVKGEQRKQYSLKAKTDCHLWINYSVVVLRKTTFISVKGNLMIKKDLNDTKYSYTLLPFIKLIKLYIESKV